MSTLTEADEASLACIIIERLTQVRQRRDEMEAQKNAQMLVQTTGRAEVRPARAMTMSVVRHDCPTHVAAPRV